MDYKEKYEQALERARIWKDKSGMPKNKQGILDDIFPELAESENEKIRKELINTINLAYDCGIAITIENRDKYLAWLEKQRVEEAMLELEEQGLRITDDFQLEEISGNQGGISPNGV